MREFIVQTWFKRPRPEIFAFFGDAGNLQTLTPPWVHFQILSPLPIQMQAGALIDYRIKIHGVPVRWRTRITTWEPNIRFADEQLKGPYRFWFHEHLFEDKDGGTLMTDKVTYRVWGGPLIDRLFVRKDLDRIFRFRTKRMTEIFPPEPAAKG